MISWGGGLKWTHTGGCAWFSIIFFIPVRIIITKPAWSFDFIKAVELKEQLHSRGVNAIPTIQTRRISYQSAAYELYFLFVSLNGVYFFYIHAYSIYLIIQVYKQATYLPTYCAPGRCGTVTNKQAFDIIEHWYSFPALNLQLRYNCLARCILNELKTIFYTIVDLV